MVKIRFICRSVLSGKLFQQPPEMAAKLHKKPEQTKRLFHTKKRALVSTSTKARVISIWQLALYFTLNAP